MNYSDIDISELTIHPYSARDGMNITYGDRPLEFNVPRMYMPFGISGFENADGSSTWNINFSLKGYDEDGNHIKKFYTWVRGLEDAVINNIVEHSESIFRETKTREEVLSMWKSNVRHTNFEPNLTTKVYTVASTDPPVAKVGIFNSSQKPISNTLDERNKYSKHSGAARVTVDRVYFFRNMIGLVWKTQQLMVWPPQKLSGFQFLD